MGILVRQNENRSQLQERLAAEMRERSKLQASTAEPLDQTKDSNYIKNTEQTSDRLWIGLVVAGLVVVGIIIFIATR